jgi:hypothetical protein
VHRDKPLGLFDFAERSIRYLVGFWFIAGLSLSILVRTGILIWRDDQSGPKRNPEALEAAATARKPASATTPPPSAAVRY